MLLNYFLDVLKNAPTYFSEHTNAAIFVGVLALLQFLLVVVMGWKTSAEVRFILHFLSIVRFLTMVFSGIVLVSFDQIAVSSDYTSTRFYIELLIASIVVIVLIGTAIMKSNPDDETMDNAGSQLLEGIFISIVLLVFIFTALETKLPDFGFDLFDKTLGTWIMNGFMSLTSGFVLSAFEIIIGLICASVIKSGSKNPNSY